MKRFLLPAVLALLVPAAGAVSQNLLQNADFKSDLSGWQPIGSLSTASWSPMDANGSATSGSALITIQNGKQGQPNPTIFQCVPVTAGAVYTFGHRGRAVAGAPPSGAYTPINFYDAPGCAGTLVGGTGPNTAGGVDRWVEQVATYQAPAGSASAQFMLAAAPFTDLPLLSTAVDDVFFARQDMVALTIPASASIHGQNQTFFHSDVWIANTSHGYPIRVEGKLRCFAGQTCAGVRVFTVPPRQQVLYEDALVSMLGAPETAGALELTYDRAIGRLTASSRVYTPSLPSPTQGTAIPALTPSEARTLALFTGLGANAGNLAGGFRSNAGAYNPNDAPTAVTLRLHAADGKPLGAPIERTWGPREAFQINDVFTAAGAGSVATTNAFLVVKSALPLFPYVTLIDNQSGDSVYIPPVDDQPIP